MEPDTPPPGAGFITKTGKLPGWVIALAGMADRAVLVTAGLPQVLKGTL